MPYSLFLRTRILSSSSLVLSFIAGTKGISAPFFKSQAE